MEQTSTTQPRLVDYIRPLTARKWFILLATILATGGVYAYYARQHDVFTASTLVYVKDPGDPITGQQNQQATDRQVQDQASLLDSRGTAQLVAGRIRYAADAQSLLDRVAITSKPGEDFVEITAKGRSGKEAADIANGFGQEFADLSNGAQNQRVASALKLSQQQLGTLGTARVTDVSRADLIATINRLKLASEAPQTIARMVQPALPPASASAPKPLRNALFALVVSLALAIGVAYGLERFDRRLKSPDEMSDAYGAPLLAVLPHTGSPAANRDGEVMLGSDFREPFRVLRTNIELETLDAPPRTIVVTSAMPGEGKTTVVRNLALALRESGRRVAVVGLDLRHPSLAPSFGMFPGRGITDVLRGDASLGEVSTNVSAGVPNIEDLIGRVAGAEPASATGIANGAGTPNRAGTPNGSDRGNGHSTPMVTVVLGGARPANPPAVLASARLATVLDELRDSHDVVLIDTAPLLAVSDTIPLLRYADATLVVGRLAVTTRDTAKRAGDLLGRVPDLRVLGIVANDLRRLEADSYGYGYGHSYGEDEIPKAGGRAARWRAKAPDTAAASSAQSATGKAAEPAEPAETVSR